MRKSAIFIVVVVLVALYASLFVVQEGERGIVLRFGKVLRDDENKPQVYTPGLHFKIPFVESVKMLDARIQTMDNQADRFVTNEKKDLIVDSYLKWRISDFSRYYLATGGGDVSQAEVLLKRKFSDRLRSEIGRLEVKDIVTDSRGQLMADVRDQLNNGTAEDGDTAATTEADDAIASVAKRVERETSGQELQVNPNSMAALGIQVIDVRVKQINLPAEVSDAIYQRMRAERSAVAMRLRSQGYEEAEKLRATADYEVTRTLAEAERQARITRGEGDAEAAKLFANAFSQDPDFYAFIRSLRAYENSFKSNKDVLVLSPDSDFFRFMKSPEKTIRP
ncbi:MAG: protease modulator HflC [Yersiniaceae bacterium]|uniref:Protein HflC n=1 Tax=Chimaeribacter coloradensis TaxID=2060068 RepID=A0A2N5E003_9GAMM|nr:protease modulator HflC [Chimaeribacter coloradensis]MDU6412088.1 protease modulator HflC [Yersiniaceae bacterium]PLR33440.1 protease modulator HflC [Chimaeribacter coloradensis]